ncbi:MAG TPA: D-alanyl-D-alanine carboxypeptidase/D-alanyl-D-alanine-endopeptidase [Thermoanaerobaculia bacterium]|nr:D-alanyl-D-alanine carboxypeptidase/D-alanyl-D-alanine-endopeptidase [Thermoanaerobaculia bacterium]
MKEVTKLGRWRLAALLAVVAWLAPAGSTWDGGAVADTAPPPPLLPATAGFHLGERLPADPAEVADFFTSPVQLPASRDRLWRAVDSALARGKSGRVGVHVRELHDTRVDSAFDTASAPGLSIGSTVFARHADDPFILASNTKLFTTAAVLDAFGPGHLIETRLMVRGEVEGGRLDGDLAVVGAGDPTFSWRLDPDGDSGLVFHAWADDLAAAGIGAIDGDLFLDHSLFDAPLTHPGWKPENELKWYQAPVSPFAFHENTVKVKAAPGPRPGTPARLAAEPDLALVPVDGQVSTAASWRGAHLLVRRAEGGGIAVDGGVYHRGAEVEMPVAIEDPVAYFGAAMTAAFAERGVEVSGRVRAVSPRPGLVWRPLAVHRTPLLDLLEVTNHESQNLFAETLTKLLGAERCGAGSWERGVMAVEELARRRGVEGPGFDLADGSGLARANRATPRQVTGFLAGMARHPHRDAWLVTLPTGGETATSLEKRLDVGPYPGRVYAKTGTLDGVSALSGYARGRSGRVYAFSVLAAGSVGHARRVQDAVVRAIIDHG